MTRQRVVRRIETHIRAMYLEMYNEESPEGRELISLSVRAIANAIGLTERRLSELFDEARRYTAPERRIRSKR